MKLGSLLVESKLTESAKTVLEEIVLVVFVIAVYVALPAGIIGGWIGRVRSKAPDECGVMRNALIESQAGEPAPRQM